MSQEIQTVVVFFTTVVGIIAALNVIAKLFTIYDDYYGSGIPPISIGIHSPQGTTVNYEETVKHAIRDNCTAVLSGWAIKRPHNIHSKGILAELKKQK